jgi:hypothetical protein
VSAVLKINRSPKNPDHWCLLLQIEMRPDIEDSEDAPMAHVVDLLISDEPMGLSDQQIVELLESNNRVMVRIEAPSSGFWRSLFLS